MRPVNQQLPGVRTEAPATQARGMKPRFEAHKHELGLGEYTGHGSRILFHVCKLDGCKYRKAFGLEIVNPDRLDGPSEYDARSRKTA